MELEIKKEIVEVCRRLYLHKFIANHDGNVSALISNGTFLTTPTAESKWDIKDSSLIKVDKNGKLLSGNRNPFSELKIHLAAYNARSDIKAVVHAHPPYSTAISCSGKSLSLLPFPEAIVSLGAEVRLTNFAIPGSQESAEAIKDLILESDVLLLANNGVLAVGDTPLQAYYRLELVEHIAKITTISKQELIPIPKSSIDNLLKKRSELVFTTKNFDNNFTEKIVTEVLKRFRMF